MKKILLILSALFITFAVQSQTIVKVKTLDQLYTYSDSIKEVADTFIFDFRSLEEVVDVTYQAFGTASTADTLDADITLTQSLFQDASSYVTHFAMDTLGASPASLKDTIQYPNLVKVIVTNTDTAVVKIGVKASKRNL